MRAVWFISTLLIATPALAEDKVACRKAFEQSQSLRDEGKLTAAREQMLICTSTCPAAFSKLCDGWLVELDKSVPSIVLRVTNEKGEDLADVIVTLDGKKVAIDGKSVALDPGKHAIHVEPKGQPAVDKEIVVAQGEQNRSIVVTIETPRVEAKPTPKPVVTPEKTTPIAAIVVGSAGILALGGFAYFGLRGDADHRSLVDGCSRTASCKEDDRDRVKREWLIADVFLASSVVLVGASTYLFLTHDSKPTTTVGIAPLPQGGAATFQLVF